MTEFVDKEVPSGMREHKLIPDPSGDSVRAGLPLLPGMVYTTNVSMHRAYYDGKVLKKEELNDSHLIDVVMPPLGIPVGHVEVNGSMTLNLGDYESVKFGVSIRLPCVKEEIEDAYKAAKKFLDKKLNEEVAEVRSYRERKRGE